MNSYRTLKLNVTGQSFTVFFFINSYLWGSSLLNGLDVDRNWSKWENDKTFVCWNSIYVIKLGLSKEELGDWLTFKSANGIIFRNFCFNNYSEVKGRKFVNIKFVWPCVWCNKNIQLMLIK